MTIQQDIAALTASVDAMTAAVVEDATTRQQSVQAAQQAAEEAATQATSAAETVVAEAMENLGSAPITLGSVQRELGEVVSAALAGRIAPVANKAQLGKSLSSGSAQTFYSRTAHYVQAAAHSLRLTWSNRYLDTGGETTPPDSITIKGSLYANGTLYQVTFNGQSTVTIAPGAEATCDPIPVKVANNTLVYSGVYVTVDTLGKKWPLAGWLTTTIGEGTAATDQTGTAVPSGLTSANGFVASRIEGVLFDPMLPVFGILGSSSGEGQGDGGPIDPEYEYGYLARALSAADATFVNVSRGGYTLSGFGSNSRFRRETLQNVSHVILQLGPNDLTGGADLATMQSRFQTACNIIAGMGKKVIAVTHPPSGVSGTFTTLGGQTPHANDAVRIAFNAWMKTLPHADMAAVWDINALVEEPTSPGKYRVDSFAWTSDGTHLTQAAHTAVAAALVSTIKAVTSQF
ncbi:SGNH/GDSL hydrolase family protein [Microvirga sp. P5_D2]